MEGRGADETSTERLIFFRQIGVLYRKLAESMIAGTSKRVAIREKIESVKRDFMGSTGDPLSISECVVKIYNDYEELIFFLAEGKADQLDCIKRMTLKDRLKFQQLKIKEIERKRGNSSSERESQNN